LLLLYKCYSPIFPSDFRDKLWVELGLEVGVYKGLLHQMNLFIVPRTNGGGTCFFGGFFVVVVFAAQELGMILILGTPLK